MSNRPIPRRPLRGLLCAAALVAPLLAPVAVRAQVPMPGSGVVWNTAAIVPPPSLPYQANLQPAPAPDGPDFTADQIQAGITMSAPQCAAYRSTIYVVAQGTGLCFRYYLSLAGGASNEVVYWLSGDKNDENFAYDPDTFARTAERLSREYRRPAVYLARMGLDGSSGLHKRFRRTWLEVEATHRAIDAINARHGFRLVHLMGQSGGAHLTGSLVGTRSDVGCAVPGSGRLAFDAAYQASEARKAPLLQHYNPDSNVVQVVRHSASTRILVITSPSDTRVPARMQTGFVEDVRRRGGLISQFFVTATDELGHGATPFTQRAMKGCLTRASDAEITAALDTLSRERVQRQMTQRDGAGKMRSPVGTPG